MSKEQLAAILQMSAQNPPPPPPTPVQLREWFEMINSQTPIAEGCAIEPTADGPAGSEMITPPGADKGRLIVYYHGGGWLFGSPRSHPGHHIEPCMCLGVRCPVSGLPAGA